MFCLFLMTGCQKKAIVCEVKVSGTVEKPGVLSVLGIDINAYQNQACNPCGECTMQPTHLFVGDGPEKVVIAIRDAVERADDLWSVKEYTKDKIVLEEITPGSIEEIEEAVLLEGITLETSVLEGKVRIVSKNKNELQMNELSKVDGQKNQNPKRLAAVYGPSYEALVVLGVEDRIVVRSDVQTSDFPWAKKIYKRITEVPALDHVHTSVNFEELMKYEPDFVYAFPRTNELNQLKKAGISAMPGHSAKNPEDVKIQLMEYAKVLNEDAVKRAEAYGEYFDEKYQYVLSKTKDIPEDQRPRVYYSGVDKLTTYGKYSDIPVLIQAAGGNPVSKELEAGGHTQINQEQLLAWDPEVIFLDHGGMNDGKKVEEIEQEFYREKNFQTISAVKNKQIYLSPTGVFYWDMGLQKILLVMNMAKILHPDIFETLDMEQEVVDFYQKFYEYPLTKEEASKILNRQI